MAFDLAASVGAVEVPATLPAPAAAPGGAADPAGSTPPAPPATFTNKGYNYRLIPGTTGVVPEDADAFLAGQPTAWEKAGLAPPPVAMGKDPDGAIPVSAGAPAPGSPAAPGAPVPGAAAPSPDTPHPAASASSKPFDLAASVGAVEVPAGSPHPGSSGAPGAAPGGAPGAASGAAGPAAGPSGTLANLGAGTSNGVAGALGSSVDLMTGALNLPARGINAIAGTNLPIIENPVGGSEWWKGAMGLIGADPRQVQQNTLGDRLAQGVGAGIAGAVLPLGPARAIGAGAIKAVSPMARSIAAQIGEQAMPSATAMGAASGYVGQGAEEATDDPRWKPLANMFGQLAGGIGAAGVGAASTRAARGATDAFGRLTETLPIGVKTPLLDDTGAAVIGSDGQPVMMTAGQAQAATRGVAQASGMSGPDLAASIPSDASLVPGDRPTVGQATGNTRVLGLERKLKTLNPEPFNTRETSNSTAQTAALNDLSHPDTQADAAGQFFINGLRQIDEAGAAREAAAVTKAEAAKAALRGTASAAETGQAMREHVEQRLAPARAAADKAVEQGEQGLAAAASAAGGERAGTPAVTATEQVGAETRAALDEAHRADDARIRRLFDAVDPDKNLSLSLQSYREAAAKMRAEILPGGSGSLSASEEAVISAAEKAPEVQSFAWVQQERKAINNYAAMARRSGDNGAARRLEAVRRGLDADIEAAVADQVRQEAPFVVSGQIPQDKATLGKLAAEIQSWVEQWKQRRASEGAASREPGQAAEPAAGGVQPGGAADMPGVGGTASETQGRPGNAADDSRLAPGAADQRSLQPNLTQADRDAMRLANSEFATHQGIFAQGAISDILETNPRNGSRFEMPDARVVEKLFPGGKIEAANAHALVAAVGPERAASVAGNALAFDLRSYAARDGAFDSKKLSSWLDKHNEALTIFPELRQRFGNLQRAQQTLDGLKDARAALDKAHPIKAGATNADLTAQYWRPGPQGTEAVRRYRADAGGAEAAATLHEAAASSLRQAFRNGEFSDGTFQSWKKSFGPALAELPAAERAKFDDFASAQRELGEVAAQRKAAVDEYQKGVAQFYLGKDPQKAVESVMSSANPRLNAARLMEATKGDKAAQDSLRKNVADWLIAKTKSTAEAGTTGEKQIAGGVFQRTIANPKTAAALERFFTPDQMSAIRAVGQSIERQNRSVNATKIAGSPGTDSDLHAIGHGAGGSFIDLFLGAGLGEAVGHLSGIGGPIGYGIDAAGVAGAHALRMFRAAGLKTVEDIQRAIVLNPELARTMLAKVPANDRAPIFRKLSASLAVLAASGVTRNSNPLPKR